MTTTPDLPHAPIVEHAPEALEVVTDAITGSGLSSNAGHTRRARSLLERLSAAGLAVVKAEARVRWPQRGDIVGLYSHGSARYRIEDPTPNKNGDLTARVMTGEVAGQETLVPANFITRPAARVEELEAERNDYQERLVATDRAYAKKSAEAEDYKAALEAAEAQNRAERNAVTARLAEEAAQADLARAAAEHSESKRELFEARAAAARARAAVETEAEADDMCIDDTCDACDERHSGTCEPSEGEAAQGETDQRSCGSLWMDPFTLPLTRCKFHTAEQHGEQGRHRDRSGQTWTSNEAYGYVTFAWGDGAR